MRVVVTGGAGQLAQGILRYWTHHEVLLLDEVQLDLSNHRMIGEVVHNLKPDLVVNTGSLTQVDRCEEDVDLAMVVNGQAVGWLAEACTEVDAGLVQVSTDYVFDGLSRRPYREEDPVSPLSAYGKSKLLGEQEARRAARHLILRTSWLYDTWGTNFYNTMLKLAHQGSPLRVVVDQWGAPTSCRALARQMEILVDAGSQGLLHVTCEGETSWHGFASAIFEIHNLEVDLTGCSTKDYPRRAPRPAYSVLSGEKRRGQGLDCMPGWMEALREVAGESVEQETGGTHG